MLTLVLELLRPDNSPGVVRRLLGPCIVLPTKKNQLEGDPRPEPRDPPFDGQVRIVYVYSKEVVENNLLSISGLDRVHNSMPTEDVLPWSGIANMAFDLRPTKDVLSWPGIANMAFDLDVLPWPGNANMAFDLRPTKDVLSWPGIANMAFDLDVLPWPGNANMAFDLWSTEDVLP
nr:hypothetical protein [Tanacetum cinerariifolium]